MSLLSRGARVEICYPQFWSQTVRSLPSRGARVEIQNKSPQSKAGEVAPLAGSEG